MKILVTGGAGFIGSHLVDRLVLERKDDIVVLDNFFRGRREYLSSSLDQIELVVGDIRDGALLREGMTGVDLVYHLAAQSNVLGALSDPDYSFQTNVIGTYEVLKAARSAGVRRVVFSSSREVYGETNSVPVTETALLAPINPYGASKAAGEMYCRSFAASGLQIVILRLANVYGPRDRDRVIPLFARQALAGETLTVFGGTKVVDFLWIDNLVDVFLNAAHCPQPSTPINIGSGKGTTLIELAERILLLTGRKSDVIVKENRQSEVTRFIAEVSLARQLLGLHCPEDPIGNLPSILNDFRCEG
jgi:nucleoside-diphosphate-sugar epimerase